MSLDPSKLRPAPIYPTLSLLNNFLLNSQSFLNNFSETIESKINNVSKKITQLEMMLCIVEAKLNSIPDEGSTPSVPSSLPPTSATTSNDTNVSFDIKSKSIDIPPPPQPLSSITPSEPIPPPAQQPFEEVPPIISNEPSLPPGMVEACNHPDYAPFFKMVKVGVPTPVIANKLSALGLDPTVVENPRKLVSL